MFRQSHFLSGILSRRASGFWPARRVLSYFFLGKELIGREAYSISVKDLALAVGGLKAISAGEFW